MYSFKRLMVYQQSFELSADLCKVASGLPRDYRRIQDQLIGAAISITLNIAEGTGRFNKKEKVQFYYISQSSAFELVAVLDICEKLCLLENIEGYQSRVEEICKMLSGLIKAAKA